jgi:hypothetical protein
MRFALARRHRTQTPNTAEFVYIFFFNWKGNTRLLTRLKKKAEQALAEEWARESTAAAGKKWKALRFAQVTFVCN